MVEQDYLPHFALIVRDMLKPYVAGKYVIDVGGYSGYQAHWCMEQGAKSAICIDNGQWESYGWSPFEPFSDVLYMDRNYLDVDDISGLADITICQNVIYHQQNPWEFCEHLRAHTDEMLVICSSVVEGDGDMWKVYAPGEGHPVSRSVAWRPTVSGLLTLLRATGFHVRHAMLVSLDHLVVRCSVNP